MRRVAAHFRARDVKSGIKTKSCFRVISPLRLASLGIALVVVPGFAEDWPL